MQHTAGTAVLSMFPSKGNPISQVELTMADKRRLIQTPRNYETTKTKRHCILCDSRISNYRRTCKEGLCSNCEQLPNAVEKAKNAKSERTHYIRFNIML